MKRWLLVRQDGKPMFVGPFADEDERTKKVSALYEEGLSSRNVDIQDDMPTILDWSMLTVDNGFLKNPCVVLIDHKTNKTIFLQEHKKRKKRRRKGAK